MINSTLTPSTTRITGGPWIHRGQLIIAFQLDDGTVLRLTLPDDWQALVARVEALEAGGVDCLEDMTYGET